MIIHTREAEPLYTRMMNMSDEECDEHGTDAQEVKEILQVISTEIPKLLDSVSKMIYNKENAENMGRSVALFYKQLIEAGMDEDKAADLTEKFMMSTSIGGIIGHAIGAGKESGIGQTIKDKIKKEIEEDD